MGEICESSGRVVEYWEGSERGRECGRVWKEYWDVWESDVSVLGKW